MTLEEYFNTTNEERLKSKDYLYGHLKGSYIKTGMLLFTPETASMWAGPFADNYAFFRLTDERNSKYLVNSDSDMLLKAEKYIKEKKVKHSLYEIIKIHFMNEYPTIERPFRLYMCGNDDASYTKCFASDIEALEFIELLEACQPLDAFVDIQKCFAFTN